jgi:hypothetical protein
MAVKNRRRVFISPSQYGALGVYGKVINFPPILKALNQSQLNFSGIFFSTMIQSGIEEFEILPSYGYHDELKQFIFNSEFLSDRVVENSKDEESYAKILEKFDILFDEHTIKKELNDDEKANILFTKSYITDLLFAMKKDLNLVSLALTPRSDLTKLDPIIDPELLFPLKNFLSLIECENLRLPLPATSIQHVDVKIFEDIITSDVFSDYVSSHRNLENKKNVKTKAFFQIAKNAKLVKKTFTNYVDLKDLSVNTMEITPKIVDVFGGKIWSLVADSTMRLIKSTFVKYGSMDKRLIIYDYSPYSKEILHNRVFQYIKCKQKILR